MQIRFGFSKQSFYEDNEWKTEAVLAVEVLGYYPNGDSFSPMSYITKKDLKKWLEGEFDPSKQES